SLVMTMPRPARITAASLAAAALLSLAAPVARAVTTGADAYSPACRTAVVEARIFLTGLGRDPHTSDPRVIMGKLDEIVPLVGGQTAVTLQRHRVAVATKCF
ncbi:hypothetical protein, partial [Streptomyces clavuligerus]